MGYHLEGVLLEVCTCNVLCPCWIGEDPDFGTCDAILAYHYEKGEIDGLDVSGLTVAMAGHIPGNVLADEGEDHHVQQGIEPIAARSAGVRPVNSVQFTAALLLGRCHTARGRAGERPHHRRSRFALFKTCGPRSSNPNAGLEARCTMLSPAFRREA